jgi:hypothetical protein
VAIVGSLDVGAARKQGVGLVEEQHRLAVFGGVEQPGQVLLGLGRAEQTINIAVR